MPARRRALAAAVLATAVAAVPGTAPAAAAPCTNEGTVGTLLDAPTFERAVVCVVNRHRANHNRRPLRPNQQLRRVASRYAARMVWEGFFSHRSPDGSSILSRVVNGGYLEDAVEWEVGENLIWASGASNTPAAIVQDWMLSPSHRENMLRPVFRETGVGVALGTPLNPHDVTGLTVASEYGVARTGPRRRGEAGGKPDAKGKHKDGPRKSKQHPQP